MNENKKAIKEEKKTRKLIGYFFIKKNKEKEEWINKKYYRIYKEKI